MHRRREGRCKPTFGILMNHSDFAPPPGSPVAIVLYYLFKKMREVERTGTIEASHAP